MRKVSIILALTLFIIGMFAATAMAAQVKISNPDGKDIFDATTDRFQYTTVVNDTYKASGSFNADGQTNYPYEIYLPNEQNPAQYRIHSNYTKDTDACASCHATHTAVGESLLQWYTVYETCMACHDGTVTTTYNVEEGYIGNTTARTLGGKFGIGNEPYLSNHNVRGGLDISAAPGGSTVAVTGTTEYGKTITQWATEFGCESCHSPHGQGGNARILHPDPNGVATLRKPAGGFTYLGELGIITIDTTTTGIVKDGTSYKVYFNGEPALLIKGYPYGVNVYDNGSKTYGATVDNSNGYTVITGVNLSDNGTADRVYGTPAIQVKMDINNYLQATETVTHISGLNTFCGACHTDYNTENVYKDTTDTEPNGSGSMLNGTYSEAYRHQVGFNWHSEEPGLDFEENYRVTCLTCHVAHGTSQDYWNDTVGPGTESDITNLVEIAGSSALKRKPNMGTCETCHEKGEGNEGYLVLSGQVGEYTVAQTTTDASAPGGGYVGSEACASCHADYVEGWESTWHSNMTRPGLTQAIAADFEFDSTVEQVYKDMWADTKAELQKLGWPDVSWPDLLKADWVAAGVNPDNIKIWSFGKDTHKQYIAYRGVDDKWYRVYSWEPDGTIGSSSGEYTCWTGCHVTGYSSGDLTGWLNAKAAGDKVPFELGISCESCHGQGGNHIKAPMAANMISPVYDLSYDEQVTNATSAIDGNAYGCGKCHSSYGHQGEFWAQQTTYHGSPIDPTGPSPKYTNQIVACSGCHDLHGKNEQGLQLKLSEEYLCASCHDKVLDLDTYMPVDNLIGSRKHDFAVPLE
ncbi:cytochrome c3 family protein [Calderihabitans maritimus]|uniref:Doubled CXXCH domain-containing protein n=1 Tax=Calderihabitans maritimus TaxID=1246530 RepID=A0A1Z5HR84_9FIRM|nr:cytochrome c3 family protein [Calderihabitans maritimus]GAW91825.1 doubled CXXCH domain-containing protein [Calderihabitans maritimus]